MTPCIGLGLDHRLLDLRRDGAITYEGWHAAGLTRVEPAEANLFRSKFEQAFTDSVANAAAIRFDLTDLNVAFALSAGPQGFVRRNYTNAELFRVVNRPEWLSKTTFVRDGQPVRYADGQFEPATPTE